MKKTKLAVEELTWENIRSEINPLNPTLVNIIDELSPDPDYTLFKASYPFGSEILKYGKFYLPGENNELVLLNADNVDKHIYDSLSYNLETNPVTMVLNKSLELFVTVEDRIIPYSLIPPGAIFGLWRILDYPNLDAISYTPVSLWDMTAGARLLFMLPKITEEAGHERLKRKYNFNLEKPKSLLDHWEIFRAIANNKPAEPWNVELIYFPKKWFDKLKDKKWKDFRFYLLQSAWRGSQFWRNQFTWDLTFSRIHTARNIKPAPYISDIVKHLLAIGVGALPGFAPANNNDCAPISLLQKAYLEDYSLKEYAPIIMQPTHFSLTNSTCPVYYSMQFHTAIELAQKSSKRSSTLNELYAVNSLLKKYLEDINKNYLNIDSTPLQQLAEQIEFTFFHSSTINDYQGIQDSNEIASQDKCFADSSQATEIKAVSKHSPFFNGCVRISNRSEDFK